MSIENPGSDGRPRGYFEGMAPISPSCPLPFYSLLVFTGASFCGTVLTVIDTVNAGSVLFHKGAQVTLGK